MSKSRSDHVITGAALLAKRLPERRFVIPGILPTKSVALLSSPPKSLKSFLMMGWSCSISNGTQILDKIPVDQAEVLYLDLESHEALARSRLQMICKDQPAPTGLHLRFSCPRLDEGGLEEIDAWFTSRPKGRLLIADVWSKLAPARRGGSLYEAECRSVQGIADLMKKHDAAAVLVVHDRKSSAARDDALKRIAGSSGLTGAVDVVYSLARPRAEYSGKLFVSGREVSEQELDLQWDPNTGRWSMQDDAAKVMLSLSPERLAVVEYLQGRGPDQPAGPKQIAHALELPYTSVRQLVRKLVKQRVVSRVRHGKYIAIIDHKPTRKSPLQQVTKRDCDRGDANVTGSAEPATNVVSFADFVSTDVDGNGQVH